MLLHRDLETSSRRRPRRLRCQRLRALAGGALWGACALWAASAAATPERAANVPAGVPVAAAELPAGTLLVTVVGPSAAEGEAGRDVELFVIGERGPERLKTVKSGADGQARFEGLEAGKRYVALIRSEGGMAMSPRIEGPASGGIRLRLSSSAQAGGHGGDAAHGAAEPAASSDAPLAPGKTVKSGTAELTADESLEAGALRVRVLRGRARSPVAGVTVAIQAGGAQQTHETDAQGQLTVARRAGERLQLKVGYGGATFLSAPFVLPERGGVKADLLVYDSSSDSALIELGENSHALLRVDEGGVVVQMVAELVNTGDAVFSPGPGGLVLPVAEGAEGLEVPEGTDALRVVEGRVRLAVPLGPGRVTAHYAYRIPYSGDAAQLRAWLPIAAKQGLMLVVAEGTQISVAGPAVAGFEERAGPEGGKLKIFKLRPVAAGGAMELRLGELPHHDRRPLTVGFVAVGLIALWLVVGLLRRPSSATLHAQRQELLDQIVALDSETGGGKKEEAARAQRRRQAVDQLAAIWEKAPADR